MVSPCFLGHKSREHSDSADGDLDARSGSWLSRACGDCSLLPGPEMTWDDWMTGRCFLYHFRSIPLIFFVVSGMLYDVVWCCMMLYDVVWCCMMLYDVVVGYDASRRITRIRTGHHLGHIPVLFKALFAAFCGAVGRCSIRICLVRSDRRMGPPLHAALFVLNSRFDPHPQYPYLSKWVPLLSLLPASAGWKLRGSTVGPLDVPSGDDQQFADYRFPMAMFNCQRVNVHIDVEKPWFPKKRTRISNCFIFMHFLHLFVCEHPKLPGYFGWLPSKVMSIPCGKLPPCQPSRAVNQCSGNRWAVESHGWGHGLGDWIHIGFILDSQCYILVCGLEHLFPPINFSFFHWEFHHPNH